MESTITSKGQITLPKAARDAMRLGPGDKVRFFFDHQGYLTVLPVVPIESARGIIKYSGPPVSVEEMDEAVAEGASQRYLRAVSRR
jgi:antitoxin PrlF